MLLLFGQPSEDDQIMKLSITMEVTAFHIQLDLFIIMHEIFF